MIGCGLFGTDKCFVDLIELAQVEAMATEVEALVLIVLSFHPFCFRTVKISTPPRLGAKPCQHTSEDHPVYRVQAIPVEEPG